MFRAVSPLIAAILLIAFTVSIGVMIIGWGRQYVQQQVSCFGASVNILKAQLDTSNNQITVGFINTGNQKLNVKKMFFVMVTQKGEFRCPYVSNPGLVTGSNAKLYCGFTAQNTTLEINNYTEVALYYNPSVFSSNDFLNSYIYVDYDICGIISDRFPIQT